MHLVVPWSDLVLLSSSHRCLPSFLIFFSPPSTILSQSLKVRQRLMSAAHQHVTWSLAVGSRLTGATPLPSSPSFDSFLSFMILFYRNPALKDCLTKLPGKSVYFKSLLPSCAVSLEALSLWGSGRAKRHELPSVSVSPCQRQMPHKEPVCPWAAFAEQCYLFSYEQNAEIILGGKKSKRGVEILN